MTGGQQVLWVALPLKVAASAAVLSEFRVCNHLIGTEVGLLECLGNALKHDHLSLGPGILHVNDWRILLDSCKA